jgi:hypothetical protein
MLRSFTSTLQRTEGNSGSWRATLFFVYSRKVAFSSIRSQSEPRLRLSGPQLVGSCSPKSAFVLAEKVRVLPLGVLHLNTELPGKISVHRLQDRAWRDLLRKVTAENVTIERSSKFVNSCVGSLPSHATPAHPITLLIPSSSSHTPLLQTINTIARKTSERYRFFGPGSFPQLTTCSHGAFVSGICINALLDSSE